MSRANELRKLVKARLSGLTAGGVFYERADDAALFPHLTFDIESADLLDLSRKDYRITVDVWCKGDSAEEAEQLADAVEDAFNAQNLPQTSILPTFYLENRRTVLDEDREIRHKQIELIAQNYEV